MADFFAFLSGVLLAAVALALPVCIVASVVQAIVATGGRPDRATD